MKYPCPECDHGECRTIDVRLSRPQVIRRRRKCAACNHRFTTYEKPAADLEPRVPSNLDELRELVTRMARLLAPTTTGDSDA